jgi:hypothetical protein
MNSKREGRNPSLIRACLAEDEFCQQLGNEWSLESFNSWLLEHYGVEYLTFSPYLDVRDPVKYTLMLLKWPSV